MIFYACNKEEKANSHLLEGKSLSSNDPNFYGILHNDITEHIIKNEIRLIDCDSLKFYSSKENQHRAIDLGIEYCLSKNYITEAEANPLRERLYDFFDKYEDRDFFVDLYESEEFYIQVFQDAGFSDRMIQTQLLIRETVHPISCTPEMTNQVFSDILEKNYYGLNAEELFQIKIQQAVTNYSRDFWNGIKLKNRKEKNPNLPSWVKDCAEWTIIMDAGGVIFGSVFGPWGSAVVGAASSIAAKRDCECNGKYK